MSQAITLKGVRLAYMHLVAPRASVEGGEPKYSAVLLIKKADPQVDTIKAAIKAAKEAKFGTPPLKGKNPLRDGDELDEDGKRLKGPEFEGCYYINASSKRKVPVMIVMGGKVQPCPEEYIVSGYYGNADLRSYGWDVSGSKGVSFGLNEVLITKRGEPLGRKVDWSGDVAGADDFGGGAVEGDEIPF